MKQIIWAVLVWLLWSCDYNHVTTCCRWGRLQGRLRSGSLSLDLSTSSSSAKTTR